MNELRDCLIKPYKKFTIHPVVMHQNILYNKEDIGMIIKDFFLTQSLKIICWSQQYMSIPVLLHLSKILELFYFCKGIELITNQTSIMYLNKNISWLAVMFMNYIKMKEH